MPATDAAAALSFWLIGLPPFAKFRTRDRSHRRSSIASEIDDRTVSQNDNLIGDRQWIHGHTLWATTAWQPGAGRSEVWDELLLSASG